MLDRSQNPAASWSIGPKPFSRLSNLLVLGGAGFVGSNLCERLVGEGHHVTCVDNMATMGRSDARPSGRWLRLNHLELYVASGRVGHDYCISLLQDSRA